MSKNAILTIDDGPSKNRKKRIEFLEKLGIQAIWFSTGVDIEKDKGLTAECISQGHILANHSYSHKPFGTFTLQECFDDIKKADDLISEIYLKSGIEQKHKFFRFPFGDKGGGLIFELPKASYTGNALERKMAIQEYLKELGYSRYIQSEHNIEHHVWYDNQHKDDIDWFWTYDSFDYEAVDPQTWVGDPDKYHIPLGAADIDDHESGYTLHNHKNTDVILMHDTPPTEEIFELLIKKYLDVGVNFLPVENLKCFN